MNKKVITKIDNVYKRHHTASRYGYCKVDMIGTYEPYKGRFGEGYIRHNGCHNGSTNFESITYFIKEGSKPCMPKDCVCVYIPDTNNKGLCIRVGMNDMEKLGIDTTSNAVLSYCEQNGLVRLKRIASQNHFGGRNLAFLKKHAIKISFGFVLSARNGREFVKFLKDKKN